MAIVEASLTNSQSTTDATSYATASITPTANRLVLAAIVHRKSAATATTPTLSGNGLTWVQVATVPFNTTATSLQRLTLFRALGASPSAGAATFDFGGVTQQHAEWSIVEFGGVNTGGTNGSSAVAQSATNVSDTNDTSASVTLAAFANAGNATYGVIATSIGTANNVTPGSGFTEITEQNIAEGAGVSSTLESEYQLANDTSVDWTMGAGKWAAVVLEVAILAPTSFVVPRRSSTNIRT